VSNDFFQGVLLAAGLACLAWGAYAAWARERALRITAEDRAALAQSNIWAPLAPAAVK